MTADVLPFPRPHAAHGGEVCLAVSETDGGSWDVWHLPRGAEPVLVSNHFALGDALTAGARAARQRGAVFADAPDLGGAA